MIDGALSRMSLMKRIVCPSALPREYSASYVPAMMPIGVPISVASSVMMKLP